MRFCLRHGDQPLAGYTILRGLGRGAFGEVYLAQSEGGKLVALKVVLDGSDLELRGARACLNVPHPHLVAVHDLGVGADGLPIFVLEYVPGRSLRSLIADNPQGCGPTEATRLLRQIALGVACLHDHGIVHRDLKPENVMLGLSALISLTRLAACMSPEASPATMIRCFCVSISFG